MARILVAEDDADIARLIEFQLKVSGFEVTLATDGAEAVEKVKASPPDLILIDWMMPVMDGLTALTHLKSDPATERIPVILMTAKAQTADIRTGMDAGAAAYLVKPFPLEQLISTIQGVMA